MIVLEIMTLWVKYGLEQLRGRCLRFKLYLSTPLKEREPGRLSMWLNRKRASIAFKLASLRVTNNRIIPEPSEKSVETRVLPLRVISDPRIQ